jgi:hypothetical protein
MWCQTFALVVATLLATASAPASAAAQLPIWAKHPEKSDLAFLRNHSASHHMLAPPYIAYGGYAPFLSNWAMGGAAVLTDRYVRLTPAKQSRVGYIHNKQPAFMESWEAAVGFRMGSAASLGGDGIGFWYTKMPNFIDGPVMGRSSDFVGLAVLLDGYDNDGMRDTPAIIATVTGAEPMSSPLVAADDFAQKDGLPWGKCAAELRNVNQGDLMVLFVRYEDKSLSVSYQRGLEGVKRKCLTLNDIDLPMGYYFGFSAETGGLADEHDIGFFYIAPVGDYVTEVAEYDPRADAHERRVWDPETIRRREESERATRENLMKTNKERLERARSLRDRAASEAGANSPSQQQQQQQQEEPAPVSEDIDIALSPSREEERQVEQRDEPVLVQQPPVVGPGRAPELEAIRAVVEEQEDEGKDAEAEAAEAAKKAAARAADLAAEAEAAAAEAAAALKAKREEEARQRRQSVRDRVRRK